jgi:hypothetical protein
MSSVSAHSPRDDPTPFPTLPISKPAWNFMMQYVRIWEKWMREKNVLTARYEDLLTNYDEESARLVDYLKLDGSRSEVRAVIDQYRPGANDSQQGLHFYKGKIGRFHEAYDDGQKAVLREGNYPLIWGAWVMRCNPAVTSGKLSDAMFFIMIVAI